MENKVNGHRITAWWRWSSFSVIIIFICLMIIGAFLVPGLPLKLNPSRKQPVIQISFSMNGQSARAVETEVTSKLEGMLGRINGVKSCNSHSYEGRGNIALALNSRVEADIVRFEASAIIRQLWPSLPEGVSYPSISMSGSSGGGRSAFLRYTINGPYTPVHLRDYAEEQITPKLAVIKGLEKIEVTGAGRMIYRLDYDYARLQYMQVSVAEIRNAVQSCLTNEFMGLGRIERESKEWIRLAITSPERNEPFDPSKIQVKNDNGTVLYLNQLVSTEYIEEEASSSYRINGKNTIQLALTAKEDANQLLLGDIIKKEMENIGHTLPEGYKLELLYDAGEYIQGEMDKIYFRSGLTVIILLAFILFSYRSLKYSFLIFFSLVSNILIAVVFYFLSGVEIQLYSLAALTISLTLIIDNTIIMSDQIIQRGNGKAFLAILTATITTMGALAVIFFMNEAIQLNLRDFALILIINLSISLFVALFLVPAMIEKMRIKREDTRGLFSLLPATFTRHIIKAGKARALLFINRIYEKTIIRMCRKRKWVVMLLILAFGLPVFMLPEKVGVKSGWNFDEHTEPEKWGRLYNNTLGSSVYKEHIRPWVDVALGGTLRLFVQKVKRGSYLNNERSETMLYAVASMPNGTTWTQMDVLMRKMEDYIKQFPQIKRFETSVESGQRAAIQIFFAKTYQRSGFPQTLKSNIVRRALELGGGSWQVYGVGDGFTNDVKDQAGSSRIKLLGYNYEKLSDLANVVRDTLLSYRRVRDVTIDSHFSWYKNDYEEFFFELDKEKLSHGNTLPLNLYNAISPMFMQGMTVASWIRDGRYEPIRIYSKEARELDVWNMKAYPLRVGVKDLKMSEIAAVGRGQAPKDIAKENQQYCLCLQYEYIGNYQQAGKVMERTIEWFNHQAPLGFRAERESNEYWWDTAKSSTQYGLLFLVSAIIFITTSILFNSIRQPLLVIFVIPVSFIGLFLTFYLFNLNFDQGGFAAFILLAGLSVNANIYVLNEYNNIRAVRPRIAPLTAFIKAINAKLRPILLTIISTMLGFIPFMTGAYKEAFWFPLAAGTIGGLLLSLFGLIFFLPVFMNVYKKD